MKRKLIASAFLAPMVMAVGAPLAQAAPLSGDSDAQVVKRVLVAAAGNRATSVSLTAREKALVEREYNEGSITVKVTDVTAPSKMTAAAATTACWSRAAEGTYYGGLTHAAMFVVGQTTKVCVKSGKVTSVTIVNKYLNLTGYPLVYSKGVQAATNNVGWEGRGLVIGTSSIGVKIGDWEAGSSKSVCVQLRLNADRVHVVASQSCGI